MQVKFCGAAGTVTGSSHLLTLDNGKRILLDCGLYQGNEPEFSDYNDCWSFEPSHIDYLILSHAHIDHIGRVPKLVKDGFNGDIICTPATRSLAQIMLVDSAMIQENEAEKANRRREIGTPEIEPLYTVKDAERVIELIQTCNYHKWFYVDQNIKLMFADAGHILGSASVTLKIKEGDREITFGFSGDIGRPDRPILKDPEPIQPVDYLIMESTYANRFHTSSKVDSEELLKTIKKTCVENKGKLLIPAFSVGRTQEITYMLNNLYNEGLLPKIPVYVDSPLATNATDIFMLHPECFDQNTLDVLLYDDDPFGFKGLQYVKSVEASKAINHSKEPAIIISSSGMMTGGRIRHHIFNEIENPKNTLLVIGYCSPGTLGHILMNGAKEIRLRDQILKVNAEIKIMSSFSAHGDQKEMIDFLRLQNKEQLQKIYLVHGVPDSQLEFVEVLKQQGFKNVLMPKLKEVEVV